MAAYIATIDGPPAAGKTTMARLLANSLGFIHLDSGSIFRAITLFLIQNNVNLDDIDTIRDALPKIKLHQNSTQLFLNFNDVTREIRDPYITNNVARISFIPEVREFVMDTQYRFAENSNIVSDGRKVGTEVFPQAQAKFFLTADQNLRVYRRYTELAHVKPRILYEDVERDLIRREKYEIDNHILLMPENAIVIDNSSLTIDETFNVMLDALKKAGFTT